MIKTYILEDLDCPHCAALIENAVSKLDGVKSCSCALLTQKLRVESECEDSESLTAKIKQIVKKVEPDVELIEK